MEYFAVYTRHTGNRDFAKRNTADDPQPQHRAGGRVYHHSPGDSLSMLLANDIRGKLPIRH